jgi:hypothetical protein
MCLDFAEKLCVISEMCTTDSAGQGRSTFTKVVFISFTAEMLTVIHSVHRCICPMLSSGASLFITVLEQ